MNEHQDGTWSRVSKQLFSVGYQQKQKGTYQWGRHSLLPAYGLHSATGQARGIINGKGHCLGKFNPPSSRAKYDQLIAEFIDQDGNGELEQSESVSAHLPFRVHDALSSHWLPK